MIGAFLAVGAAIMVTLGVHFGICWLVLLGLAILVFCPLGLGE